MSVPNWDAAAATHLRIERSSRNGDVYLQAFGMPLCGCGATPNAALHDLLNDLLAAGLDDLVVPARPLLVRHEDGHITEVAAPRDPEEKRARGDMSAPAPEGTKTFLDRVRFLMGLYPAPDVALHFIQLAYREGYRAGRKSTAKRLGLELPS